MSVQGPSLVTGGTGFVGAHLVRRLVGGGRSVRVLARPSSDRSLIEDLPVEWALGDLSQPESLERALEGCSRVFHCAADYRLYARDPSSLYRINVDGSKALFDACRRHGVERIVYTSSVAALATPLHGRVSDEESRAQLQDVVGHYKRSKFLAQQLALEEAALGLPVVIVNPSTPVGPGDIKPTATGKIVVDFLQGKMPAFVDTGLNLVPVEDVAAGHLLAEEKGQLGRLYILGHLNLSLREILEMLASITGLSAPRWRIPYPVAWLAGAVDTLVEGRLLGREPRVPLEGVRMARKKMYFEAERAKRELGFRPGSVRSALARAVEWFCRHGYAPAPPRLGELATGLGAHQEERSPLC
jgi:dihydroflavonol-4-reductase